MNFKKFDYQYLEYDFYRAFLLLCQLWKEKHKTTTPQCQWYNLPLAVNDPSKLLSERSNVFNDGKAINDSRTRVLKSIPLKSRSYSLVKMFESIGQKKISQKHRRDNFISHTIQKKYLILIHENIFLQTIIPLVVTKALILLPLR